MSSPFLNIYLSDFFPLTISISARFSDPINSTYASKSLHLIPISLGVNTFSICSHTLYIIVTFRGADSPITTSPAGVAGGKRNNLENPNIIFHPSLPQSYQQVSYIGFLLPYSLRQKVNMYKRITWTKQNH